MKKTKIIAFALVLFLILGDSGFAATFTINDGSNASEVSAGDGVCLDTNGNCSLMGALQESNALAGNHTLLLAESFMGDGATLPVITRDNLFIDFNNDGYIYDRNGADSNYGLRVNADNVRIHGIQLRGHLVAGIEVQAGADGTEIQDVVVGITSGGVASPNTRGIQVFGTNTDITSSDIHSNSSRGIEVNAASGTTITDNNIGVYNGNTNRGNLDGILITGNTGGTNLISGNLIGYNTSDGIVFNNSGTLGGTWKIQNNDIGVNAAGDTDYGNSAYGIYAPNSATSTLSVTIGTDGDGTNDGTEGNVISGNNSGGVRIESGSSVTIAGNNVGVSADATTAIGNTGDGVYVDAATVRIGTDGNGTSDTNEANTISGNSGNGIHITGAESGNVTIAGNRIGVRSNGAAYVTAAANTGAGIYINDSGGIFASLTIGGAAVAQRNVISSNGANGIQVANAGTAPAALTITNNYIGVGSDGATALGNTGNGILIADGAATSITSNVINNSTSIGAVISGVASLLFSGNTVGNVNNIGASFVDIIPSNEATMDSDNTWTDTVGPFSEAGPSYYFWRRLVAAVLTAFGPQICNDGVDNDSDGNIDLADGGCTSITDTDETGGEAPAESSSGGGGGSPLPLNNDSEESSEQEEESQDEEVLPVDEEDQVEPEKAEEKDPKAEEEEPAEVDEEIPVIEPEIDFEEVQPVEQISPTEVIKAPVTTIRTIFSDEKKVRNLPTLINSYESMPTESAFFPTERNELQSAVIFMIESILDKKMVEDQTKESIAAKVKGDFSAAVARFKGELEIQSFGETITIDKNTDFQFEPSYAEAKKLQQDAIEDEDNLVVLTTFTDLDLDGIADVLQIAGGGSIFDEDLLTDNERIFFNSSLAHEWPGLDCILPAYPSITNLYDKDLELAPETLLWIGGKKIGEKYDVFAIGPIDPKKKPQDLEQYYLGEGEIDENNRSAFEMNLRDEKFDLKWGKTKQPFYLVVQDRRGHGSLARVLINPLLKNTEFNLDNGKKILTGYAEPGEVVVISWQSVLLSSVVLADASEGYFEVEYPTRLEAGDHKVFAYLYNYRDKVLSDINSLLFKQ